MYWKYRDSYTFIFFVLLPCCSFSLQEDEMLPLRLFHYHNSPIFRKGSTMLLAASWLAGFLFGSLFFLFCDHSFLPLMHRYLICPVSIVGLILFPFLPFLFSAFAVFLSKPVLLHFIGFWKAFVFSLFSLCFFRAFGSVGWLLRMLLLFTEICSLPLLYGYQRICLNASSFPGMELVVFLSVLILLGTVDYGYILPFAADILILWKG